MFDRMYLDNRQPWEMIERCDGFHPSGLFHSYLGDWMWFKITTEHP
jgi:tRNA A58 N-methylase Trm61